MMRRMGANAIRLYGWVSGALCSLVWLVVVLGHHYHHHYHHPTEQRGESRGLPRRVLEQRQQPSVSAHTHIHTHTHRQTDTHTSTNTHTYTQTNRLTHIHTHLPTRRYVLAAFWVDRNLYPSIGTEAERCDGHTQLGNNATLTHHHVQTQDGCTRPCTYMNFKV